MKNNIDLVKLADSRLLKNVTGGARFHPEWKRRQVGFSRDTRRKLTAMAKTVSKKLGYQVFPMQLAGLIVEAVVEGQMQQQGIDSDGKRKKN